MLVRENGETKPERLTNETSRFQKRRENANSLRREERKEDSLNQLHLEYKRFPLKSLMK